jgi:hypothetical protein
MNNEKPIKAINLMEAELRSAIEEGIRIAEINGLSEKDKQVLMRHYAEDKGYSLVVSIKNLIP